MSHSQSIDGTWEMVRGELDGDPAPELVVNNTVIEIADGAYMVRFDGETADRGTFELGTSLQLKTIVLHGIEGTNAGRTIPCIYQLQGDRLRVCYGMNGVGPTEFTTAPGQHRYLVTYRLRTQ